MLPLDVALSLRVACPQMHAYSAALKANSRKVPPIGSKVDKAVLYHQIEPTRMGSGFYYP